MKARLIIPATAKAFKAAKYQLRKVSFILLKVIPLIARTGSRPVLFVRPVGMGDIICTFPAALELKSRHPNTTFIYCCLSDFSCLPRMAGVADFVTDVFFSPKSIWAFLFSAIYAFEYDEEKANSRPARTIIEEFCEKFNVSSTDVHPRLQAAGETLEKVKSLLVTQTHNDRSPVILIHLGPSWPVREWPFEQWVLLIRKLREHGFTNIIQLGTDKHVYVGVKDTGSLHGTLRLVNRLTLEESIAMLSLADLFIGIDSGLLHVAASTKTPAVGIFGATSPQYRFSRKCSCSFVVSRVECQGCHHRTPRLHWITGCPYDIRCMKAMEAEEVFQVSLLKLKTNARKPQ